MNMHDDSDDWDDLDLEIMAYADGMLDRDPGRKRAVEAEIAADPARQRTLRILLAQNEFLRNAYGGLHASTVPDRLYRALREPERPASRAGVRNAVAAAAIACIAAVGGWQLGERFDVGSDESVTDEFIRQSYQRYMESHDGDGKAPGALLAAVGDTPVNWLSDRLSLRLRAPDMSERGYAIVHRETVRLRDTQMVYLEYASADGETFSLFLRPRWETRQSDVRVVTEDDDTAIAVWLDGPLAATVTGKLPSERMKELAADVREAMRASNGVAPVIEPAPGSERKADLLPAGSSSLDGASATDLGQGLDSGLGHVPATTEMPVLTN